MKKKIYFIWIWGIWMSALARFYFSKWYEISWSDSENTKLIEELKSEWIKVEIGHSWKEINWKEEIIFYTEAIPENNFELKKAKKLWLKLMTYFQWLWELSKKYKTIAIAGAHWKSTTTAMIWILMEKIWLNPTVIVWTKVPNFWNKNILVWNWEYLIVEACEYRESFLNLNLFWAVILNIEAEHLDYYKNEENYLKAFENFIWKIPEKWFLIINWEDKNCEKILKNTQIQTKNISKIYWEKTKNIWNFKIPWEHIKFDAICAIKSVEKIFDKKEQNLEEILQKNFSGTRRRFEVIWEKNWNLIISDYAHHPTEIKLTLKSLKEKYKDKKIICIFEPHQYSRTIELFDDFCKSFEDCDKVIIPSIYKVRDSKNDIKIMSAEKLANWINKFSKNSLFIDWYFETEKYLKNRNFNEIFIFMWAWDIDNLARKF